MNTNDYFYETVDVLKSMYKNDLVAMSQIMIAEKNKDIKILKEYLECVEIYVNILKNNL